MVEYYMALRGKGGVMQVMLETHDSNAPRNIDPPLDDQIEDMRMLQNAGFWEIAKRAQRLIVHSQSAAPRIAQETGEPIYVLPFANQRVPNTATVTPEDRLAARQRVGLDAYPEGTIHLGSFGYVDTRTNMTDVVLEAAAWLIQWGYPIALHLIGSASATQETELRQRAREAGLAHFHITGFQSEEQFRDWLLAVDLGVQLRISPLLGVSGPLSDLAAFGTPAVASSGLCVDVQTPAYITRLPDEVSPVIVAEGIEQALSGGMTSQELERARQEYLSEQSPLRYAELLLEQIKEVAE
jgi:glycosyltransferase involved in cell wall biosynthesis